MARAPAARPPDFALVGPPKTATTALFSWLRPHPGVFMPEDKELHFFDAHRERGTRWYQAQFAEAGDRLAGEATTTYLAHPTAIADLAQLNPRVKLVVTVRDPVDRAWSHYNYGVARGWFEEPFAALAERELNALRHGRRETPGLIDESRYGHHLERARRHLPADQILVLRATEIASEPEHAYASLCGFLGIDASSPPPTLGTRFNETRHVRYPRLYHAILKTKLDRALPAAGRARLAELLSAPGYPELGRALRRRLDAEFAQDQALAERFLAERGPLQT